MLYPLFDRKYRMQTNRKVYTGCTSVSCILPGKVPFSPFCRFCQSYHPATKVIEHADQANRYTMLPALPVACKNCEAISEEFPLTEQHPQCRHSISKIHPAETKD